MTTFFQGQHTPTHTNRGFTFVETLVAISVLLLAVVAPLTLGSQGITTSRIARDQVTASLLAQEAIEYVRSIRDGNELAGNPWTEGFDDCLGAKLCYVSVSAGDIAPCEDETCPTLSFDEDSGVYVVSEAKGLIETKYTRSLNLEALNDVELRIEASVAWQDGLVERTVTLEDYLYDW